MLEYQFFISFILVFILLLLSAFFAGIESSFFSMDWIKIKRLAKEGNKSAKIADFLRSHPKELVITFLIGNELVNITASAITTAFVIQFLGEKYVFIAIIVMTILILTFGEITPKTIGNYYSEKYALFTSRPFYAFYILATPFRFILMKIASIILKKLGLDLPVESHKISEEDVRTIVSAGKEKGLFSEEEKEIIEAALELDETSVSEIMTPRRDIFAIENGITIKQTIEILKNKDYSRIPVYKENLDNIIGVLYVKDIIFLKFEGKENEVIDKYLRKPLFVPEFTPLLTLMKEFEKTKNHFAIVVDEHGTVVGIATFQDLVEFLVGDIPQEFESEEPFIEKVSEHEWKVSGKIDIEELSEEIGLKLPEDYEFDTLAGFIFHQLEKIPQEGETFEYEGFLFKIEKVENNRIVMVRIKKLQNYRKRKNEVNK